MNKIENFEDENGKKSIQILEEKAAKECKNKEQNKNYTLITN